MLLLFRLLVLGAAPAHQDSVAKPSPAQVSPAQAPPAQAAPAQAAPAQEPPAQTSFAQASAQGAPAQGTSLFSYASLAGCWLWLHPDLQVSLGKHPELPAREPPSWWLVVGSCWLACDCFRWLVVGCWWLLACGWWLVSGGWWLVAGRC